MTEETRNVQILNKMLKYCCEIDDAIAIFGDSFAVISTNDVYKNAVAMCVLQIGELSANLTDEFKAKYNALPWKQIKGMRNLLAHGYGNLDIEELWNTVKHDIHTLRTYCTNIVKEIHPDE